MVDARRLGVVGFAAVLEVQADRLGQCFLVVFDREVVMRAL